MDAKRSLLSASYSHKINLFVTLRLCDLQARLHLTDCSVRDHCNHWILDTVMDLAKNSWGGGFPKLGGSLPTPNGLNKKTLLSDAES